jgi:hypothetical protein
VGLQVSNFSVTPINWTTGGVPSLIVTFRPRTPSVGGTVILAVQSTSPRPDLTVFARVTPANPSLVMVGLPNCTGTIGTLSSANRTLRILLPSSCVLTANVSVTIHVPSTFFGEMPPGGTTVVFSLATDADPTPRLAPGYIVGVCGCRWLWVCWFPLFWVLVQQSLRMVYVWRGVSQIVMKYSLCRFVFFSMSFFLFF